MILRFDPRRPRRDPGRPGETLVADDAVVEQLLAAAASGQPGVAAPRHQPLVRTIIAARSPATASELGGEGEAIERFRMCRSARGRRWATLRRTRTLVIVAAVVAGSATSVAAANFGVPLGVRNIADPLALIGIGGHDSPDPATHEQPVRSNDSSAINLASDRAPAATHRDLPPTSADRSPSSRAPGGTPADAVSAPAAAPGVAALPAVDAAPELSAATPPAIVPSPAASASAPSGESARPESGQPAAGVVASPAPAPGAAGGPEPAPPAPTPAAAPPDDAAAGPPASVPAGPPASTPPAWAPAGPPASVPVGPPAFVPVGPPASVPVGPPAFVPAGPPASVPVGPPDFVPVGPPAGVPGGRPAD